MERALFDCDGSWDGDNECMIFYNVVLKVSLGEYRPGDKFGSAAIEQTREGFGWVVLYTSDGDELGRYKIVYSIATD